MMFYQENWNVEQRILNFEIDIVIEVVPALGIAAASFLKRG
jgi:hypothetical protein